MSGGFRKYSPEDYTVIFRKYWAKVYSICYRYTRDKDAAKDMVQNILISLWERNVVLDDEISLEKYLSKAAKYQVFKYLRDHNSSLVDKLDHTHNEIQDSIYNTPHHRYLFQELNDQLESRIQLLNEPARSIFKMSRLESLSHKEIARRMGIAVKTVEYHLAKAKQFMRKMS